MPTPKKEHTLQTVERALAFLEVVAKSPAPLDIKEVSERLTLNTTTCYHLLRTLVAKGYIERQSDGTLILGASVDELVRLSHRPDQYMKKLAVLVKRLTATSNETCSISYLHDNQVILGILEEGTQRLRVSGLFTGLKGAEYRRAAGKAVLAHLSAEKRQIVLEEALAGYPKSKSAQISSDLEKELPEIARVGWALDDQSADGFMAFSSPIFNGADEIFGAVSLIAPSFRIEKSRDSYLELVISTAAEATRILRSYSAD